MTFGDSNTHGTPPMPVRDSYGRLPAGVRWPTVTDAALGPQWALIEEGLPGRTTNRNCPDMGPHMNGQTGLRIALESHGPIDLLVVMLGTNDLQAKFGATAQMVTGGMASLLSIAHSTEYQTRHDGFQILMVCPPPVIECGTFGRDFYLGASKSADLPMHYAALADTWGVHFLNAGQFIKASPIDGVHFDADAHVALGHAIADKIATL
ncbi:SGNH/GDSL hydrolase family protein [Yoonia sediminilitoris]|uniref:Lysophospholipase L1-like esterase n=1 Tax=Yoonia sediminilitoris TaxID=1286148 RepID=A0A2T6KMY7_9RHOB|nr:SGNH/GDSL hydrolase family protein [Yoonia sediminilitoris]PUB17582.1 lysophospholipase L1-like esterase [Yoonia sediminilitoris]RCW97877.1 lysophospholipase L1-like esterase [Yoonia sediminilitoris]